MRLSRTGRRLRPNPPTGSAPDPIGWASARLFAAGVERQQRLVTLRFLGILLETADAEGHVHCDPDDLAGLGLLNGMESEEVARSRVLLETFGILEREPTGWFIKHFAPVDDEVPPAEVMAAISRTLARPVAEAPAPEAPAPQVVPLEAARARRDRRWIVAPVSAAGAAAAAAVVLAALVLSGQMRVPIVSQPAGHSQQSAVGAANAPTSTPAGAPRTGASPSSLPSQSAGSAGAASITQAPPGPPGATGIAAPPAACPVGSVTATVDHMGQQLDGTTPSSPSSFRASLGPLVHTSVSGTVRDNSASPVVVNPFPVTVTFSDPAGKTSRTVTATALSGATTAAPGASIPWSVTVDDPQDAPVPVTANAGPPPWQWQDGALAYLCPH